jgi:cytosine/adenosine deaminase-related metal-dependent hydrolase/ubiquinone/menaquinone biosynthesis C-methylase UbiE
LGTPTHQSPQAKGGEPIESGPSRISRFSARNAYRLASQVYDAEPNPVVALEQRFVERLLPEVQGLDVADLGCGTARWLCLLAARKPRTLIGVDCSAEMLAQARRKLGSTANLVLADCDNLPLPRSSADLILCSFLVSYLSDLAAFAEQLSKVLRPGGTILVSDLHPTTASRLGWRRGFHVEGSFVDLSTYPWSIGQVVTQFENLGIKADALIEPQFGDLELALFQRTGKTSAFYSSSGQPAIYILQLSLKHATKPRNNIHPRTLLHVTGARVALGANESAQASMGIEDGRVAFLGRGRESIAHRASIDRQSVDLTGFLLLPGLVNAHDHLDFALFPRLGRGGYRNFVEWADDIYQPENSPVREHRGVPKNTRLWWGGIRNLICGATTVCHHNPYVREVFHKGFAVRVLRQFGWAHSLSMDHNLALNHKSTKSDRPFIIHLAEGLDEQSGEEIFQLARKGALDDRTVIVHGLGLDERGKSLLCSSGAALVWCPTSNVFLFGKTHDRQTIQSFPRVALGSDSPLTSQGDLLDEIHFAHETLGMPSEDLYSLVTKHAAQALRLTDGEGTLQVGGVADLIGVRDKGGSPAQTLSSISCRDVELVAIGGRVQLASTDVLARLPRLMTIGLRPLEIDGQVRWIRAPLDWLFAEAHRYLPGELNLGGKKVRHGFAA